MNQIKEKFLYLAVIKKKTYNEIAEQLGVDRKLFTSWWDELKSERIELAQIRDKWQSKCPKVDFDEFKGWYSSTIKECHYCGINEYELDLLWTKYPNLTKRKRGRRLEIERLKPNEPYSNLDNLVFCCYWCNNAKTDTFSHTEFELIGKEIKKIWVKRLHDN